MEIRDIILNALKEDMPDGDITTDCLVDDSSRSEALLIAKDEGILSGLDIFEMVMNEFPNVSIKFNFKNGDSVKNRDIIAEISGQTNSILKGERVALNILQRMSGVATKTRRFVEEAAGNCKIYDTRKTTPNMRVLEKRAVLDGGGVNHRFSLSDMAMIKDNHIKAAGSITRAVELVRAHNPNKKIEVEVESINELNEALATDCDIIMLDNMDLETMRECVRINNGKKVLEGSGNMRLERIKEVSMVGIDYVSVGELTHAIKSMDISLKFK